ncbi:MAG TPA: glycosyltransferase family 2 protein [Candidatus Saccharimonadales bacterium]
MSSSSLVSVVIPAYNYGKYITETIDSVLAQQYTNIEIVVIDDGSSDNTAAVVASYGDKVRYIYQENRGLSAARNAGMQQAQGDYIVFCDADDKLHPDFIARTMKALNTHSDAAFAYTQQQYFEASNDVTKFPPYNLERLKQGNFIPACVLFRSSIIRNYAYDTHFMSWEDWDMYLTLAEHGLHGVLVDEPLVLYRKHAHDKSMLDRFAEHKKRDMLRRIRYKHWRLYGLAETFRFTLWYWRSH